MTMRAKLMRLVAKMVRMVKMLRMVRVVKMVRMVRVVRMVRMVRMVKMAAQEKGCRQSQVMREAVKKANLMQKLGVEEATSVALQMTLDLVQLVFIDLETTKVGFETPLLWAKRYLETSPTSRLHKILRRKQKRRILKCDNFSTCWTGELQFTYYFK